MRTLMGLVVAGGLLFGMADESKAQMSLSIGSPYVGQGYGSNLGGFGGGYGGGYGIGSGSVYNSYQSSGYLADTGVIGAQNYGYNSGYGGYVNPGFAYSSGYAGYAAPGSVYRSGYVANPLTGYQTNRYYGAYGYGNYGYGSRDGFRPLRPIGRMFR